MKYLCLRCGKTFDYFARIDRPLGKCGEVVAFETISVCPFCGSEDYEDEEEE